VTVYAPAGPAGPGRGGTRQRTGPTLWVVWHTSQGGEGDVSAEGLAAFIRSPATDGNVASYQVIFDTDRVLEIMPPEMRANHAGGANDKGVGGCVPGRAEQTRAQWLDATTAQYLEQGCQWAADMCHRYDIPPVQINPGQMQAGVKGIVDHNTVRLAFGQTTHTDCGPNFPWDVVMPRIAELVKGGEDMASSEEILAAIASVNANVDRLEKKFDTFREHEYNRDRAEAKRDREHDAKGRAEMLAAIKSLQ
jgi:N-acetylmuramoyl-L-alanine amidase